MKWFLVTVVNSAVFGVAQMQDIKIKCLGQHKKHDCKNALRKHVQDRIEDLLAVVFSSVGTFANSPSDGIKEHKESDISSQGRIGFVASSIDASSITTRILQELPNDEEVKDDAKDEKAPFVARANEHANQEHDTPSDGEEDGEQDRGPADSAQQQQRENDDWKVDGVANPSGVEHLSGEARHSTFKFCSHRATAKVARQDEIVDGRHEQDGDCKVVEHPSSRTGGKGPRENCEQQYRVQGHNSPIEAGAMIRLTEVCRRRVYINGIVSWDQHHREWVCLGWRLAE